MSAREAGLEDLDDRVREGLSAEYPNHVLESLERVPAGLSSRTYLAVIISGSDRLRLIVKVGEPGRPATKNRDLVRQVRVLKVLETDNKVPVPRVVFADAGAPPERPPLFAMEFVEGQNLEPLDDTDPVLPSESDVAARFVDCARVLGTLHRTDVCRQEFEGFQIDTPGAELEKWTRAFSTVPDELRQGADSVAEALQRHIPEPFQPALVHGDYRLGNTLCRGGAIAAVIDWEIWGLGDPRCDLAWFLHMSDTSARTVVNEVAGVPPRDELVAHYEKSFGQHVPDLSWFDALALYKRASATALIVKHNRRSPDPDPRKERAERVIGPLLDAARSTMSAFS